MMMTSRNCVHTALKAASFGVTAFLLVSCAGREVAPPASAPPPLTRVDSPPEWRPGDRWVYDWTSGNNTGTKTVEVLEIREVNTIRYYVMRIGDIDHYYTFELQWSGSLRDGRVEARMVPPHPWLVWPLEVGKRWVHRGSYEERDTKSQQDATFAVVTAEVVAVPAGRFHAFKVVREGSRRDSDQYWYAPEARWYVRWIGRRGDVEFEERLRMHDTAPRLIPKSAPETPASKTQ